MKCVPEKNNPLSFEGPEIFKCKVCIYEYIYIKPNRKNWKYYQYKYRVALFNGIKERMWLWK